MRTGITAFSQKKEMRKITLDIRFISHGLFVEHRRTAEKKQFSDERYENIFNL